MLKQESYRDLRKLFVTSVLGRGISFAGNFLWLTLLLFGADSAHGKSVSATGAGYLVSVPIGRDSVYTTSIRAVNSDSIHAVCFLFDISPDNRTEFYEPLPKINWVEVLRDTLCAGPLSETSFLELMTKFPADSSLYNRRFGTTIKVSRASAGIMAMNINLKVFIETESRRFVSNESKRLQVAPTRAYLSTEWDSIVIFNNTKEKDTLSIFWSQNLNRSTESSSEIVLFRKVLLWRIPAKSFLLDSGEKETIYFKKPFDYFGSEGYIIILGKNTSSFCKLEPRGH